MDMPIDSHPVWAELVEALFLSSCDSEEEGQPFDKLRAHGFSGYRA
jgi:hypothetical protein